MAVDLEAIRKRVQELSGNRRNSTVQLWKPDPGEYKVRGIPWKTTVDGMPFIERRFYYIGDSPRILAPTQFGKPDPINDLIRKLYSSGKPDDRVLAKKLHAKMTAYMAVIVRGQEDKGVMVWSMNKFIYQRILSFYNDAEIDCPDILDPVTGLDLKVVITPSQKKFNGKTMMDTNVDAARKQTKLSDDPEQVKKWLEAVPNLDDAFTQKSPQEIEQVLNAWLAGGGAEEATSDGSSRGDKPKDELDKLVDEVKAEVRAPAAVERSVEAKAEAPKADKQKRSKKAETDVDVDAEAPTKKTSLDEAFADLMTDDE
jgi:hypothetical protein